MFSSRSKIFPLLHYQCHRLNFTWTEPPGQSTGVSIYNPIVKQKVHLKYKRNEYLSWYSCGPTVYDVSHIGHASSYVRLDIIRRVLHHWFDIKPLVAWGVTDIDDKIVNRSKLLEISIQELAKKYELEFFHDMKRLNVLQPHFVLRVTDHITEIIEFVTTIIQKGHAYTLEDVYGKVTRAPVLESSGHREGQRLHPADFALWKASKPGEPSWDSPWARGRPGWHIECSTMASNIFGGHLDVHSGGLDLAFPHHENEEAQSCAYHCVDQWVNYWIHTGHLLMNGMKMSKSMKNFISIEDFLKVHNADQFRMLCLMTHYRTSIDYTEDVMKKAVALVEKFRVFLEDARSYYKGYGTKGNVSGAHLLEVLEKTKMAVKQNLGDDFNTAESVNRVEELVRVGNGMLHCDPIPGSSREVVAVAVVSDYVQEFLQSMGLFQTRQTDSDTSSSYIIEKSLDFRNTIRQIAMSNQDKTAKSQLLQSCDSLRDQFKAVNITVKDTNSGTFSWSWDNKS